MGTEGRTGRGRGLSLIYRRKAIRSWEQGTFHRLSPLQPSGQALALILSLSPLSIIVPGVANAGRGAILDLLPSWSPSDLDASLADLQAHGACIDLQARVILLPWELDEAAPESPNVVRAWRRRFDELPACDVKAQIDRRVSKFLIDFGQGTKAKKDTRPLSWIEAWDPTLMEASDEPSAAVRQAIAEGSDNASPKHRGSAVAPFPESGIRDQRTGSRDQGTGDRNQAPDFSEQAAGSRKGKSVEKGEPRHCKPEPAACFCGALVVRLLSGQTVNANDGATHDVVACAAHEHQAGVR